MAISGNATTVDGAAVDLVRVFRWPGGSLVGAVQPDANGDWSFLLPGDSEIGLTYIADGCRPVTHGPYFVEGADDYWESVTLLLHFDGNNSSGAFVDSSSYKNAVTRYPGALITSDKASIGESSAHFNGTPDGWIASDPRSDFSAHQDFTLEMWLYHSAFTRLEYIAANRDSSELRNRWVLECSDSGRVAFMWWNSSRGITWTQIGYMSPDTWTHVAVSVGDGLIRTFLDGQLKSVKSITTRPSEVSTRLVIGRSLAEINRNWTGYIDELRFTSGVGRYSQDFAPPVQPYPSL